MKKAMNEHGDMTITLTPEDLRTMMVTIRGVRSYVWLMLSAAISWMMMEFLQSNDKWPDKNFIKQQMDIVDGNIVLTYVAAEEPANAQ